MLTKQDIKWLNKLSASKKVTIIPYNPKAKEVFEKQKKEILSILGKDVGVLHLGATGLGISGQGEIDLVIPTSLDNFDRFIGKLKKVYGEPKSFSPNNRVRFNRKVDDIDVEIVIVNQESEGWKRNIAFNNFLKNHPEILEEYKNLKKSSNGQSLRVYYQRKMEFINNILEKILPIKNS